MVQRWKTECEEALIYKTLGTDKSGYMFLLKANYDGYNAKVPAPQLKANAESKNFFDEGTNTPCEAEKTR